MKKFIISITILIGLILSGCSKPEFYPKDIFYQGLKAYENKDLDKAQELLRKSIYKAKGMTTQDIMNAKFILANIYFQKKMYIDAIVEFEEYITLYPTAPNIPEALYKLALSYLLVSPSYQRDLTYAKKAEEKAKDIIINYPDSEYIDKAKEVIKKVKQKEIKHYLDIAHLYEKLGKYYSASVYYQLVIDKYYRYINLNEITKKLAKSLINTPKQYEEQIGQYKENIKELEEKIKEEKSIEKKNILLNRKRLLEDQLFTLEKRVKESVIKGKKLLKEIN